MSQESNSIGIRPRLLHMPPGNRKRALVEFLLHRLRSDLDLEPDDELTARSRFEQLGIDSKRALELKMAIERDFECSLSTTLLFDYPTPEALAGYLLSVAFEPAEKLDLPRVSTRAVVSVVGNPADVEQALREKLAKYGM